MWFKYKRYNDEISNRRNHMEHRIIMSKEEIMHLLSYNKSKLIIAQKSVDCFEDFLLIKDNGEINAILCLNSTTIEHLNNLRYCLTWQRRSVCCLVLEYCNNKIEVTFEELIKRYLGGFYMVAREIKLEESAEERISYSNDDLYNINSWGADLSFREIMTMYKDGELIKPELQRKYVWTRGEASRFIDSILLGLPVPSVFLAKEADETMLIIDGFQRIMTVNDYVNGIFSGDGKIFKLSNSENINIRWKGKAFAELESEEQRRIRNTTIHAIIFEQKHPRDDTGMFQIFERINTGGRTLKAQEIRNCVYQGKCNDLLFKLNKNRDWRFILGLVSEDPRMMDLELILRYFAMRDLHKREEANLKQINLSKYLNQYMGEKTKDSDEEIEMMESDFCEMIENVKTLFEDNAFRNLRKGTESFTNKINPAIYDALSVSTSYVFSKSYTIESGVDYLERYKCLLNDESFRQACSNRTTNIENIKNRIMLACQFVYGVDYEW